MRNLSLLLLCACVVCSCSQTRTLRAKIYKDRYQEIALQRKAGADSKPVPRGYSHPVTFDVDDLKYILHSIQHQEKGLFGWSDAQRLFSANEIYHMTPRLVEAFAKATPDDEVEFSSIAAKSGVLFSSERFTDGLMFVKDKKLNCVFANINVRNEVSNIYDGDPKKEYSGVMSRLVTNDWQRLVEGAKGIHYNWIELEYEVGLEQKRRRDRSIKRRIERHRTIKRRRKLQETGWEEWTPGEALEEEIEYIEDDVVWPSE